MGNGRVSSSPAGFEDPLAAPVVDRIDLAQESRRSPTPSSPARAVKALIQLGRGMLANHDRGAGGYRFGVDLPQCRFGQGHPSWLADR